MSDYNREREIDIERGVRRRIQRRMLLVLDFVLLFVFGILISGRPYVPGGIEFFGAMWIFGFFIHVVLVAYWEWTERAVRSALDKERNAYYRAIAETVLAELRDEKPKRDHRLTLSDDGEIEDGIEVEEREYRKRR